MGKKGSRRPYRGNLRRIAAIAAALGCVGMIVVSRKGGVDELVDTVSLQGTYRNLNSEEKGWQTVNVHVGDPDFLEPVNAGFKHYSQSGQDEIVLKLLKNKKNGFFIDLAANDAIELSNTMRLEKENSWTGLCIEPNPAYWYRLAHRKCRIVGALVGKKTKQEVQVRFDNGVNGGIVDNEFDNKDDGGEKEEQPRLEKRYTATIISIFEKFNVPKVIDYLSLDVEGAEYWVMKEFPFDKYMFKVMTVERPKPQLQELLKSNGYKFIKLLTDFGETLWVHESMMKNKVTQEVAELKYACWDYKNRRSCDPEFMKMMKRERKTSQG